LSLGKREPSRRIFVEDEALAGEFYGGDVVGGGGKVKAENLKAGMLNGVSPR